MKSQRVHLRDLPPVKCPCGQARRAFVDLPDSPASLHEVEISRDAKPHYHRTHTEVYYVLAGEGQIELDGQQHPVAPGDAILIAPGCRHRAVGEMRILNVCIPPFDPADEWFD